MPNLHKSKMATNLRIFYIGLVIILSINNILGTSNAQSTHFRMGNLYIYQNFDIRLDLCLNLHKFKMAAKFSTFYIDLATILIDCMLGIYFKCLNYTL